MFGWLCIAFLGFSALLCMKGVLFIAHINKWVEWLPLLQLDLTMIIFMLFTRNCLTTLSIIIQMIEEIQVKWRDYFHLGSGYTIFLIVLGFPMFDHSIHINVYIVFIVDFIIYIIYQLEWAIILESLKGIRINITRSGGRDKILRVILCMVPPITPGPSGVPDVTNQDIIPVRPGYKHQIVGRSMSPVHQYDVDSQRYIYSPSNLTTNRSYEDCKRFISSLTPSQREYIANSYSKNFLNGSGLSTLDMSEIALKWRREDFILSWEDMSKVLALKVGDPGIIVTSLSRFAMLRLDWKTGETYYDPFALRLREDDWILTTLFGMSITVQESHPSIVLIKKLDGLDDAHDKSVNWYINKYESDARAKVINLNSPSDKLDGLSRDIPALAKNHMERWGVIGDENEWTRQVLEDKVTKFKHAFMEFNQKRVLDGTLGNGPFNNSPTERASETVEYKKVPIALLIHAENEGSKK